MQFSCKMATLKLFLDTRTKKKNDIYPVKLLINHKQTSVIGVGISIRKDQWNGKEVIHSPKSNMFNAELKAKLVRAQNRILRLSISGEIKKLSQKELLYCIETNNTEPEAKQDHLVEEQGTKTDWRSSKSWIGWEKDNNSLVSQINNLLFKAFMGHNGSVYEYSN